MSEKNKAGLNEVDMQAVVAAWIVANDGCFEPNGWVSCSGEGGFFDSTPCPLASQLQTENISAPVCDPNKRAVAAKDWLDKYFQQKAEAAKKQDQAAKPEPVKSCGNYQSCGNCRHAPLAARFFGIESSTTRCFKKESWVPVGFTGCPDFEPRTSEKSALERLSAVIKSGSEAAEASSKIAAAYPSQIANITQLADTEEKKEMQDEINSRWTFRHTLVLPPDVSVSDIICTFMASAPQRKPSACAANLEAERIAQLEKENAELQSTSAHLREELVWQFEQLTKKIGTLQDRNDRLQRELDAATKKKNSMDNSLIEQLKQMGQRTKELEREADERSWPPRPRFFL